MLRENKEVVAVDLLVNLLVGFVLHVVGILRRNTVDNNLLIKLHSKSVFVNSNLLDIVAASDLDASLSHQVLDDHVRHQLAIGVPLLVQAVHLVDMDLVQLDGSTVATSEDGAVGRVDRSRPNPIFHGAHGAEEHAFSVPEGNLLVTAGHNHEIALGVERNRAGVEAQVFRHQGLGLLTTLDLVRMQLLIPRARNQEVVRGVELLGAEGDRPYGGRSLIDGEQLSSLLVFHQDDTVEEADSEQLAVGGPVARDALGRSLGLVNALAIGHPEAEVDARARSQSLQHGVEAEGQDLFVVAVLEQTLPFSTPDDDRVIGATGGEALTVLRVSEGIHSIFVTLQLVDDLSS
mmetsp:Transcript_39028/g.59438  ORF Transcript_39028/g.59438 Transcript_39028/m.59438 type:complete len:347 (-) Transcript_39028:167-1207(-)